jgi:hypothetical protein
MVSKLRGGVADDRRRPCACVAKHIQKAKRVKINVVLCSLAHDSAQPLHGFVRLELPLEGLWVHEAQTLLRVLLVGEAPPAKKKTKITTIKQKDSWQHDGLGAYSLACQLVRLGLHRNAAKDQTWLARLTPRGGAEQT